MQINSFKKSNLKADKNVREARLSNGLVKGHAFTITNLAVVDYRGETVKICNLKLEPFELN